MKFPEGVGQQGIEEVRRAPETDERKIGRIRFEFDKVESALECAIRHCSATLWTSCGAGQKCAADARFDFRLLDNPIRLPRDPVEPIDELETIRKRIEGEGQEFYM